VEASIKYFSEKVQTRRYVIQL